MKLINILSRISLSLVFCFALLIPPRAFAAELNLEGSYVIPEGGTFTIENVLVNEVGGTKKKRRKRKKKKKDPVKKVFLVDGKNYNGLVIPSSVENSALSITEIEDLVTVLLKTSDGAEIPLSYDIQFRNKSVKKKKKRRKRKARKLQIIDLLVYAPEIDDGTGSAVVGDLEVSIDASEYDLQDQLLVQPLMVLDVQNDGVQIQNFGKSGPSEVVKIGGPGSTIGIASGGGSTVFSGMTATERLSFFGLSASGLAGSPGPAGPAGGAGPAGAAGAQGPQGDPGGVAAWTGTYAGGTQYSFSEAVFYEGSSYVSRVAGTNTNQGNQPDISPNQWMLLAQGVNAVGGNLNVTGAVTMDGAVTLGDAAGDTITINGTPTFIETTTFNGGVNLGNAPGDAIAINGNATFGATTTATMNGSTVMNGAVTLGDAPGDVITVGGNTTFGAATTTTFAGGAAFNNTANFNDAVTLGNGNDIITINSSSTSITGNTTVQAGSSFTTNGPLVAGNTLSVTGGATVTSGGLTVTGDSTFNNNIIFEGATADVNETILTVIDPTNNDNTITLPDASGEVPLLAVAPGAGQNGLMIVYDNTNHNFTFQAAGAGTVNNITSVGGSVTISDNDGPTVDLAVNTGNITSLGTLTSLGLVNTGTITFTGPTGTNDNSLIAAVDNLAGADLTFNLPPLRAAPVGLTNNDLTLAAFEGAPTDGQVLVYEADLGAFILGAAGAGTISQIDSANNIITVANATGPITTLTANTANITSVGADNATVTLLGHVTLGESDATDPDTITIGFNASDTVTVNSPTTFNSSVDLGTAATGTFSGLITANGGITMGAGDNIVLSGGGDVTGVDDIIFADNGDITGIDDITGAGANNPTISGFAITNATGVTVSANQNITFLGTLGTYGDITGVDDITGQGSGNSILSGFDINANQLTGTISTTILDNSNAARTAQGSTVTFSNTTMTLGNETTDEVVFGGIIGGVDVRFTGEAAGNDNGLDIILRATDPSSTRIVEFPDAGGVMHVWDTYSYTADSGNNQTIPVDDYSVISIGGSGGTVTAASGMTQGQLVTFLNAGSTSITLNLGRDQAGGTVLAQYDVAQYVYSGSTWYQVSFSDNE